MRVNAAPMSGPANFAADGTRAKAAAAPGDSPVAEKLT